MIQDTSLEVYHKIKENGLLSRMRFEVYEAVIKENRPVTQGEIQQYYFPQIKGAGGTVGGRFSELERLGVIHSVGTRACEITGNNKMVYVPTGELPKGKIKFKSKKEIVQELHKLLSETKHNLVYIEPLELSCILGDAIDLAERLR